MSKLVLNEKQHALLLSIIDNKKCFDKRDNTFLMSNRQIAMCVNCSASKVDQLFRVLKSNNLIKHLNTTHYIKSSYSFKPSVPLRMLDPRFMFWSYTKTDRWYYSALYTLGGVEEADQWRKLCRELNVYINPQTGEIDETFNWYFIDKVAEQYTCFDKCYRKGYKWDHPSRADAYRINELKMSPLSDSDIVWFDKVNKESTYNEQYERTGLSKIYSSVEESNTSNIYKVKI